MSVAAQRDASTRWPTVGVLTAANLVAFAWVTVMNVALPQAREDLGLSASASRWVVTLYPLALGSLLIVAGRVADLLGLRHCLVAGLVAFAGASLLGGLAPDGVTLLAARALQGAAAATVAATAVPLMSAAFPGGRPRARAFGALGVVMGIGTAGSFLLAGALVELASWRWCLLVGTPIALLLAVGVTRTAPPGPPPARARLDVRGAMVLCLGLAALVGGLDRSATAGWADPAALVLVAGGGLALAAYGATLRRRPDPLVPPALLTDARRVAAFVAPLCVGVVMFGGILVLTTTLQEEGLGPVATGLAFLPFAAGAVLASWGLPALRARLGSAPSLALGLALTAVAVGTLGWWGQGAAGVLPAMVLLGAGGTVVMVLSADLATDGAGTDGGVAGSLVNAAQQVGAAVGTALLAGSSAGGRGGVAVVVLVVAAVLVGLSRPARADD